EQPAGGQGGVALLRHQLGAAEAVGRELLVEPGLPRRLALGQVLRLQLADLVRRDRLGRVRRRRLKAAGEEEERAEEEEGGTREREPSRLRGGRGDHAKLLP